jgi:outer membrane protein OmpA-like peptidoglycan-associated protein
MILVEDGDDFQDLSQAETEQLGQFFHLLADLDIIEPPPPKPEPIGEPPIEVGTYLSQVESFPQPQSAPIPPPTIEQSIDPQAFQHLQQILVGAELEALNHLMTDAEEKLAKIEHQIYEPAALKDLLVPRIGEVLTERIAVSEQEIINAIAPIIDQIIENRTQQDRDRMGSAIAAALSPAISENVANRLEETTDAIAPTMGRAIKKQIAIEQDAMVDALYPIIGSTVGKYMAEVIEQINEKLERALSLEGMTRKIRAKIQGVSEVELMLREAMPFRVQAIFLIHKASGLLIAEAQSEEQRLESDLLAGMLTAIRGFVNDCVTEDGEIPLELDEIDYGTSKIVLEVAGYCYLAVVMKGSPPQSFRKTMQTTLGRLVLQYDQPLQHFEGDPGTIPTEVHGQLAQLREASAPLPKEKGNKPSPLVLCSLAIVGLLTIPWGTWQYLSFQKYQAESKATTALYMAPELSVYNLTVAVEGGHLKLLGRVPNLLLRQQAEQVVQGAMPRWQIDNAIVAVNVPADPVLTTAEVLRVTRVLNQWDGVAIATQYKQGKVIVEGSVSRPVDAKTITQAFEQIPGVTAVNNTMQIQLLRIDVRFYFETALADLHPDDRGYKLQQVLTFLTQHPQHSLRIIGFSYSDNSEPGAQQLALDRANALKQILLEQGIAPNRLQSIGLTSLPPGVDLSQPQWLARCVMVEPIEP